MFHRERLPGLLIPHLQNSLKGQVLDALLRHELEE